MPDFMSFPTPREYVLTCGNTTIGVIPEICLITHFQVGSWQILYRPMQTGNIKRWGYAIDDTQLLPTQQWHISRKRNEASHPWFWTHFTLGDHRER